MKQDDPQQLAKMESMPADPRDCRELIARLRAQGITPEWIFKAEQKIDEYERQRKRLKK